MSLWRATNFWDCPHGPLLPRIFLAAICLDIWAQSPRSSITQLLLTGVRSWHFFKRCLPQFQRTGSLLASKMQRCYCWTAYKPNIHSMFEIHSKWHCLVRRQGCVYTALLGISISQASFLCKPIHRIDFLILKTGYLRQLLYQSAHHPYKLTVLQTRALFGCSTTDYFTQENNIYF